MMDWRSVLDADDEAALRGYARPREQFRGTSPALLVIDVTETFVGPNLPVDEAQKASRQACGEAAWAVLPFVQKLIERFRSLGRPVVFTTPDPSQRWVGAASAGVVTAEDSTEAVVVADVAPREGELVLTKTKASAFFGTPLVTVLNRDRVDTLVIAGGTTSGCVRATAVDGSSYGYEVLVAEDACFDRSGLSHAVTLRDLDAKYARVTTTAGVIDLVSGFQSEDSRDRGLRSSKRRR